MKSNFLTNCLRFNARHSNSPTYMQDMVNAFNWYLSQSDDGLHIIACRMALYNFHKYPAKRLAFWKLYLHHKNEFFKVFTTP